MCAAGDLSGEKRFMYAIKWCSRHGGSIFYECPNVNSLLSMLIPALLPHFQEKFLATWNWPRSSLRTLLEVPRPLVTGSSVEPPLPFFCIVNPPYTSHIYVCLSVTSRKTRYWSRLMRAIVTDKSTWCVLLYKKGDICVSQIPHPLRTYVSPSVISRKIRYWSL